jgi:hypothetical protein
LNSKAIAAIIVFSALTLVLNLSPVKIPAPYATFLIYQIWEIPIVAAFLLYGLKVSVGVSIVNTLALLAIFQGELPTGPLYNLAAVLSMLLGIYLVHKAALMFRGGLVGNGYSTEIVAYASLSMLGVMGAMVHSLLWLLPACVFGLLSITVAIEALRKKNAYAHSVSQNFNVQYGGLLVTASTITGVFTRVIIMSVVNLTFLPFPPPVGFGIPQEVALTLLPLVGFFNATLALYTIPIGHTIAKIVGTRVKTSR